MDYDLIIGHFALRRFVSPDSTLRRFVFVPFVLRSVFVEVDVDGNG